MLLKLAASETASGGHKPQTLAKKIVGNFGWIIILPMKGESTCINFGRGLTCLPGSPHHLHCMAKLRTAHSIFNHC